MRGWGIWRGLDDEVGLGFHQAGFQTIWANVYDKKPSKVTIKPTVEKSVNYDNSYISDESIKSIKY